MTSGRDGLNAKISQCQNAGSNSPCLIAGKCVQDCEAKERICPCYAHLAAKVASLATTKLSEETKLFVKKPNIPCFDPDSLVIGKLLGEGGFSEVHEVRTLARPTWGVEDVDGKDGGYKCCVEEEEKEETNGTQERPVDQHYAVKYLRRRVMVNGYKFQCGAADLAVEARFLSALDHPNVVKLHGIAAGSIESNIAKGKHCGFFIVIDRLYRTLEERLETWRDETSEFDSFLFALRYDYHGLKRRALLSNRLRVAMDIASTLQYLHSLNVIYRDLKPDNIGFDSDGTVKIFDFGLAKELKPSNLSKDGAGDMYNLTGLTGSTRYMAPEVERKVPYGLSADVYSFGILLFEICSLEKAFQGVRIGQQEEVVMMKFKPVIETNGEHFFWPRELATLIQQCWSDDARERPKFEEVVTKLEESINKSEMQGRELVKEQANVGGNKKVGITERRGGIEPSERSAKPTWSLSLRRGSIRNFADFFTQHRRLIGFVGALLTMASIWNIFACLLRLTGNLGLTFEEQSCHSVIFW